MRTRPPKKKVILAFGESANDTKSLKELVAGLRGDLPPVSWRSEPPILRVSASPMKKVSQSERIRGLVAAERVRASVVAVLVHRDLDAVEPRNGSHESHSSESNISDGLNDLAKAGIIVIPVVAAWELEAWWFMWPEQVAGYRPRWRKLQDRNGIRVDRFVNAKEKLRRELRPTPRAGTPDYTESDSPQIAARIRADGLVRKPKGRSIAYERLIAAIDALKL